MKNNLITVLMILYCFLKESQSSYKCPYANLQHDADNDFKSSFESEHDGSKFNHLGQSDFIPSVYTSFSYSSCPEFQPKCDPTSKYRTFDGSCNNLHNPTLGMADTAFNRLLPADYRDNISLPRRAVNGNPLPLPRGLSIKFFPDINNEDFQVTLMGMSFSQFLTHDMVFSSAKPGFPGPSINCCDPSNAADENRCLPIMVPPKDPFFSKFNVTCLSMQRNFGKMEKNCGPSLQQVNLLTHFLDGSQIYGSSKNLSLTIREFKGGRLLTTNSSNVEFLPHKQCEIIPSETCYVTAEVRANQNPQLIVLHTLFAREHNRIAGQLQEVHPSWNDEKIYQETRAIIIAQLEHITYNEWLPLIVGPSYMNAKGLFSNRNRRFTYNERIEPVIINSFTSAVFRVGHSGAQGTLEMYQDYQECPMSKVFLSDFLDRPTIIQKENNFDGFLRGLTKQPMQYWENYYTSEITTKFARGDKPFGLDLLSVDVQRGRDHGLPPYVKFVELCTGFSPQSFDDLVELIPEKNIKQLREMYDDVKDIDLFIGGNLERPAPLARVGYTFQCIIGEQFYRLKYGDRFWYEVRGQPHSFTNRQLYEIKKITLARIICDNSDIVKIPPRSFIQISKGNHPVDCSKIPSINLTTWIY